MVLTYNYLRHFQFCTFVGSTKLQYANCRNHLGKVEYRDNPKVAWLSKWDLTAPYLPLRKVLTADDVRLDNSSFSLVPSRSFLWPPENDGPIFQSWGDFRDVRILCIEDRKSVWTSQGVYNSRSKFINAGV